MFRRSFLVCQAYDKRFSAPSFVQRPFFSLFSVPSLVGIDILRIFRYPWSMSKIKLSDHFTFRRLLRFTIPSIIMMVCTSVYSIVDGLFVSNFVGKEQFAALNLIMPVIMALSTIGFMFGTGGSAIVGITLGEGKKEQANEFFSLLVYVMMALGFSAAVLGFIFMRPLAIALGAKGQMISDCVLYGRISMISLPFFMLQIMFQSFYITAERPEMSLKISIATGLTNMILDYVFIAVFHWGLAGAAFATVTGELIGGTIPIFYFFLNKTSILHLGKTRFSGNVLAKTCLNGSSEMMTNISTSIVNMLYNYQVMRFAGEDGVAAYGVIMYANFIFAAMYLGYTIGCAPLISYNHGADNRKELHNLFKKSLMLISVTGILMLSIAQGLAGQVVGLFVGYDKELLALTITGFRIYSISYLLNGFNIWGSGFFTALGNGIISAQIAFFRTLLFQCSMVLLLPVFFEINGVWAAIIVAELLALVVTGQFLIRKRKVYGYA